ncbi:MAG: agmatinase [Planctomycetota bacterium]
MKGDEGMLLFGGDEAGHGTLADASYVVVPAPLEQTVSYGGGTAAGPDAILRASAELEFHDEETGRAYWPAGAVHTVAPLHFGDVPSDSVAVIRDAVRPIVAAGQLPITLGGEHTVTVGAMQAVLEQHEDAALVMMDAHLDLRSSYGGTPLSHACVARRMIDDHGVAVHWCGIRSYSAAEAEFVAANDLHPLHAHDISPMDTTGWARDFVRSLPARVYLSLDIDGMDPAAAPGTGTPEPGGLSYRQVLGLIREICKKRQLVGADVVEVAPIAGQQVTEFTAARLLAKLIGGHQYWTHD